MDSETENLTIWVLGPSGLLKDPEVGDFHGAGRGRLQGVSFGSGGFGASCVSSSLPISSLVVPLCGWYLGYL